MRCFVLEQQNWCRMRQQGNGNGVGVKYVQAPSLPTGPTKRETDFHKGSDEEQTLGCSPACCRRSTVEQDDVIGSPGGFCV